MVIEDKISEAVPIHSLILTLAMDNFIIDEFKHLVGDINIENRESW
jgi:hypothetical protein